MKQSPYLPQERLARIGRVGGDARLTSVGEWQVLSTTLLRQGLQLVHSPTLLDQLWNEEPDPELRRPDFPKTVAKNYDIGFAGKSSLFHSSFTGLVVNYT